MFTMVYGPFINVNDRIMPMSDVNESSDLSLPAESFQNVLLFQPFVAPLSAFLRPGAGIKFEMSLFSG